MIERGSVLIAVAGAAGAAVAVAVMEMASFSTEFPLMMIPFATSIVLVMGSPEAEPAQPRALVGGHLLSTLVGLMVLQMTGPGTWAAALAVGLGMIAVHLTRTFHRRLESIPLSWSSTACRGRSWWRPLPSARCCSPRSHSPGTTWQAFGAPPGRRAGGNG